MQTNDWLTHNLKPCPFCGESAELDTRRGYSQWPSGEHGSAVSIACTGCNVEMMLCREDHRGVDVEDLVAELVANWNRRTP